MTMIRVLRKLEQEGGEVFIVGGFVRDYLRNKVNTDLDIVVRKLPIKEIKRVLKKYGKVKEVNLSKVSASIDINILLFKIQGYNVEAQISLPKKGINVMADMNNTLRQDAETRDFKINALYLPIGYKSKKDVIDMVGGRNDIDNKMITSNGDPIQRFMESPIRMMRAISLSARTGYKIEEDILKAITKMAYLIKTVPMEAIRNEFTKILLSKKPSTHLKILRDVGLLELITPELDACVEVTQDKRFHKYDVFEHMIYTCDFTEAEIVLRLAGLLHDLGKVKTRAERVDPETDMIRISFHKHEVVGQNLARDLLRRLKYNNEIVKKVVDLIKNHMYYYTHDWSNSAIRKFIKRVGLTSEYINEDKIGTFPLFQLRASERKGAGPKREIAVTEHQKHLQRRILELYKESSALDVVELDIDGNDIMILSGMGPGKYVGQVLNFLLERVLEDPKLNNRKTLIGLATQYVATQTK